MLETEHARPAEHSVTTFLTDTFLQWLDQQHEPWFAHTSFIRPHPPYDAAGHYAHLFDHIADDDLPQPLPIPERRHFLHDVLLGHPETSSPPDAAGVAHLRRQYWGMVTEVDHHLGRIWQRLRDRGDWENTIVIITADHGEQLCDQGLVQKAGYYDSSYHIVGIVRNPRHATAVGLLLLGLQERRHHAQSQAQISSFSGLLERMKNWFKGNF